MLCISVMQNSSRSAPFLFIFVLVSCFSISHARAQPHQLTIDSATSVSDYYFSQGLGISGEFSESTSWSADYTYSRSTDAAGLSDQTSALDAGLAWVLSEPFALDMNFSYSTTPAEGLVSRGLNFGGHYRFAPFLQLSSNLEFVGYTVSEVSSMDSSRTGTRRMATSPAADGTLAGISQRSLELRAKFVLADWLSAGVGAIAYSYDKSVAEFLTFLDSTAATLSGTEALSSAVSGFSARRTELFARFYPAEDWDLGFNIYRFKSAADSSFSNSVKFILGHDLSEVWSASVAWRRDFPTVQNTGYLYLSYDF